MCFTETTSFLRNPGVRRSPSCVLCFMPMYEGPSCMAFEVEIMNEIAINLNENKFFYKPRSKVLILTHPNGYLKIRSPKGFQNEDIPVCRHNVPTSIPLIKRTGILE